jgi:hypothetical protein
VDTSSLSSDISTWHIGDSNFNMTSGGKDTRFCTWNYKLTNKNIFNFHLHWSLLYFKWVKTCSVIHFYHDKNTCSVVHFYHNYSCFGRKLFMRSCWMLQTTSFHICKQKTIDNCTWNLSLKFIFVILCCNWKEYDLLVLCICRTHLN